MGHPKDRIMLAPSRRARSCDPAAGAGRSRLAAASRLLSVIIVATCGSAAVAGEDPTGPELFETKVRPVLVEHCYGCHSAGAKKLKGGLRLDTADGLAKGGDSGPAVAAGKPANSRLVQAVRHVGDVKMPPTGKLPDAVI